MPTLGLAMIVKNGAQTLRRCLESALPSVDAIVIGDTGSVDETVSIAREFGATVLSIAWTEDFAEARNTVLQHVDTDWVLVLDADEELSGDGPAWIRNAIHAPHGPAAYHIQVRNYLSPRAPAPIDQIMLADHERPPHAPDAVAWVPSAAIRLFRRDPRVFYRGCVHEMVEHQINDLGLEVRAGGFLIHHFGWYLATAQQTREKRATYFRCLAKKLGEMPNDSNTLVRYAYMLFRDYSQTEQALAHLRQAAEINDATPGAWLWTGDILVKSGRFEEALAALERVPVDDFPHLRAHLIADCLSGLQRLVEARTAYQRALALAPLDRLVQSKLGLTEVRLGDAAEGLRRIRQAAAAGLPIEGVDQLMATAYMAASMPEEALAAGEHLARTHGRADAWLEVARLKAGKGDWPGALQALDAGIAQLPDTIALHQFRTQATVALRDWPAAVISASRVAELSPSPETLLRLAAILHHAERPADAQQILSLRDEYLAATHPGAATGNPSAATPTPAI